MPAQKIALGYAEHQLLHSYLETQLKEARESLETYGIPDAHSQHLRGRIYELKALLELITP